MENLSSAKKPAKITEPIESDGVKQVTNSKAVGKTQLLQFAVVCLAIASFLRRRRVCTSIFLIIQRSPM